MVALSLFACGGETVGVAGSGATGGAGGVVASFWDMDTQVDKVDLLLMVDNSLGMGDKQALLELSIGRLVDRLVNPLCTNGANPLDVRVAPAPEASCPSGFSREFEPISDLHIGVVTSSLGGHGADQCSPEEGSTWNPTKNDMGHLLGSVRPNLPQAGPGFLAWNPLGKLAWGDTDAQTLIANLRSHLARVGETGCGFEAQLESWYRFLIDPEPPAAVIRDPNNPNFAIVQGIDQTVLDQRAAFLRPDSLVAVIMLTDENDCSTADGGIYWLPGQSLFPGSSQEFRLPRSTSQCLIDPNNQCCRSCGLDESGGPPVGCASLGGDPECQKGSYDRLNDSLGLRCFDQKRRFGVDFLYPIMRYVEGLTQVSVTNRAGESVPNPLYSDLQQGTAIARDESLVFLAGIVGVPWQDLATAETLADPIRLKYLKASELRAQGRWDVILGNWPRGRPTDSLMWESVDDRTTLGGTPNPVTNDPLAPGSSGTLSNPINGHEYDSPERTDLQYACIFPLSTAKNCVGNPPPAGCDCSQASNKPLCQGTTQTHAKAYPGLRELQVLKGMGENARGADNAIVASICPKITDPTNPAFAYHPAVDAIVERFREAFTADCFPRALPVDPSGRVSCKLVEVVPGTGGCPACRSMPGRTELAPADLQSLRPVLVRRGVCEGRAQRPCEELCVCEVVQLAGSDLAACQNDPAATGPAGFCYVDEMQSVGSSMLTASCPPFARHSIRMLGEKTPGAIEFVGCPGIP